MKIAYNYQVVKEERKGNGRWTWLIQATAKNGAKSEQWIGQHKLKRLHEQGKVTGLSPVALAFVGKPLEQPGNGKVYLEPRKVEPVSNWATETKVAPKKWTLQDEVSFKPTINIKSYCYSDPKGRWHVIMCDGVEDEDTYPDQKWAQEMADMYNKEVEENKQ